MKITIIIISSYAWNKKTFIEILRQTIWFKPVRDIKQIKKKLNPKKKKIGHKFKEEKKKIVRNYSVTFL